MSRVNNGSLNNIVVGTKEQIINDISIPNNSIIFTSDETLVKTQEAISFSPATLYANKSYYMTLSANLTISTLLSNGDGQLNEWHFVAIMDSTSRTVSFTPTIRWATPLPTFMANKIYEFSIIKVNSVYLGYWVVY